jgi:hypothetical protein
VHLLLCGKRYRHNWKPHLYVSANIFAEKGAPWEKGGVGNGGLSLRKKSKMLELLKYKYIGIDNTTYKKHGKYIAEDLFFNGYLVKNVNIHKPSPNKAKEFSVEHIYYENPFGIHNAWNTLDNEKINTLKNKYPHINTLINLQ